mgnify:CR=1 FL=1
MLRRGVNGLFSELLRIVREAIYAGIVRTGAAPDSISIASATHLTTASVEEACRGLADAHVIVVEPGTTKIRSAPPFSGVATPFLVRAGATAWYAPCAWDAFGIPAALDRDVAIDARCGWSGEPIPCGVDHGRSYGDGLIHLLVPAARFWDDIFYT